jgi:hypothetical protein
MTMPGTLRRTGMSEGGTATEVPNDHAVNEANAATLEAIGHEEEAHDRS